MSQAECSLGRHRRLILPPIAVLKDQPRRRRKELGGSWGYSILNLETLAKARHVKKVYAYLPVYGNSGMGASRAFGLLKFIYWGFSKDQPLKEHATGWGKRVYFLQRFQDYGVSVARPS